MVRRYFLKPVCIKVTMIIDHSITFAPFFRLFLTLILTLHSLLLERSYFIFILFFDFYIPCTISLYLVFNGLIRDPVMQSS